MHETLKEHFDRTDNSRITTIRLIRSTGNFIEEGKTEYIVNKYGDMLYHCGYSEGNGKVSIWVCANTTK